MKYSEAKKAIETLPSKYSIDMEDIYFSVNYNSADNEVAYVDRNERYVIGVWNRKDFSKLPFSNKLHMILSELAMTLLNKRTEQKKRYVKICNHPSGYLNIDTDTIKWDVDTKKEILNIKTKFTDKEIEQLKQRDDIPLDWNKVKFEEVEDD